ncbi:LVIVD repeat-containing protein [Seonamhaeicola maritimus]|uniref:LVIVD repeat-containing protein n=1 Tax=Seonamhaeicola maritimus TaxID=2591822 RepID=A0A5C7GGC2_9FLAO|nr:hypothetical protein [Seonamhaeicola maritimus]TXG36552.1 hypothetical protein FUA22_08145 [Seonamhaeicola maritimus]
MKTKNIFLTLLVVVFLFSCNKKDDENLDLVTVATPEFVSKSEFRKMVDIVAPQPIKQAGKIYAYGDYIFVNDVHKGVHILDNTDPKQPKAIKYIVIPGNEDISIKNDYLYADSATDLVVFNISDINNVMEVARLQDVFQVYNFRIPEEAVATDYEDFNWGTDILIGWKLEQRPREEVEQNIWIDRAVFDTAVMAASAESSVGTGGSLARFQIVDNYLYTVESHEMTIFNISNLSEPNKTSTFYAGNNIETLFQAEGYLYVGSTDGMYIYDLVDAENPTKLSEFIHWTGCDPVVVDGDYAYLTIRGGNNCGEQESVLEVIDVSDKTDPTLAERYALDNPYGLGVKGNMLFVCDGTSGLKLFNRNTPVDLNLVRTIADVQATDVIPLENSLIMIGDNTLYQYKYMEDNISFLSSFSLN